jgi:hypothetical protein
MMENKIIDTNIHFEKWTEWIKEYPKLEEIWNSIPEPLYTLLKIQIDNYALSALQSLETALTEKHRAEVEGRIKVLELQMNQREELYDQVYPKLFVQWYSGMDETKIETAFRRWCSEPNGCGTTPPIPDTDKTVKP